MEYEKPNMEMLWISTEVITTSGTLDGNGNSGLDEGKWEKFGL